MSDRQAGMCWKSVSFAARGTTAPATSASGTVWLCRPGLAGDPCESSETATVVSHSGSLSTQTIPKLAAEPKVDCFMRRWHKLLNPLVPASERKLGSRFAAIRLAFVELARRAKERPHRDDRLFTSHLIDLVTATLVVKPSSETSRLIRAR